MKPEGPSGFWRSRVRSFVHAGRGVALLLGTQKNARIHLLATVVVAGAGFYFRVTPAEWCFLSLAMGLVWAAEGANTAIEFLADRVSREHDEWIGNAKDTAAGGVLLAAVAAAVIGFIVLGPRVWFFLRGD
jgi:diacylglycerol kinase (ATP)